VDALAVFDQPDAPINAFRFHSHCQPETGQVLYQKRTSIFIRFSRRLVFSRLPRGIFFVYVS
jgi:hypothetical protein